MQIFYNIFILPIFEIIDFLFNLFNNATNDVLFSIFIVSFFVNIIRLPMYMRAEKLSEEEHKLQEKMAPQIKSIKKNFRGDEKFMLLKTCYRQHHYHPIMALRKSLSLLIQVPFFMAAYLYFNNSVILNITTFINDKTLSVPDGIIELFGFSINFLPILMTIINIISAKIYSNKKQIKDQIQMYSFALFFLVLLYNSPAGLVIYWTFNNLFSLFKNIGLKQKNPSGFLKFSCLFVALLLSFKIMHFQIINYCTKEQYIILITLTLYYIFCIISFHHKNKLKLSFNFPIESNFKIFLFSIITLSIITGLLIPTIIFSSSMDFIQTLNTNLWFVITNIFSQAIGVYIFCPIVLYCFLNKKIQVFFTLLSPLLVIFYSINLCLYSGELGILSTDFLFKMPKYSISKIIFDITIIIFLIFIIYYFSIKKRSVYIKNTLICLLLSSVTFSMFNIFSLYKTLTMYNQNIEINEKKYNSNIKPIKLSQNGKNVIVIFIDRAIGVYAQEILENDIELKNKLSGFVLYPNTVSFHAQTIVAYQPMIAGYEYTPENMEKRTGETYEQKTNEAYLVLPKIFLNNGFSSTIIQPHSFFDNEDYSVYENTGINIFSFPKSSEKYSFYRNERERNVLSKFYSEKNLNMIENKCFYFSNYMILPSFLKKYVYNKANKEINSPWDERLINNYKQLIALPYLTEIEKSKKNHFVIFNNETTHINKYNKPYIEEQKYIECEALYAIAKFVDYLKENNIYDNTRIIIVSDHGHFDSTNKYLGVSYMRYNPLLMQKDFIQNRKLSVNFDFMTNADMPILATDKLISNPRNPYTGKLLTESADKTCVKILSGLDGIEIQKENKHTARIKASGYHKVKKDIFKEENWELY